MQLFLNREPKRISAEHKKMFENYISKADGRKRNLREKRKQNQPEERRSSRYLWKADNTKRIDASILLEAIIIIKLIDAQVKTTTSAASGEDSKRVNAARNIHEE